MNIIIPISPDLFPPNLLHILPLIYPPTVAPQPRAILQNPAYKFNLSSGVS